MSILRKSLFLLVFSLVSSISLAAAQPYVFSKHYLIDNESKLSIADVQDKVFIPYQNDLSLGFQEGSVWLRFDIQPVTASPSAAVQITAQNSPLILRMGPYVLDTLVLYESLPSGWQVQSLGDRIDTRKSMCPDGKHCFALSSSPTQAATLFLKVSQRGIFTAHAEVVPWQDLPTVVASGSGRNAAALAVSMSLLLLGIALLVVERSVLLLVFCCFEAVVVLLAASTTGLLAHYLSFLDPNTLDVITHHLFNLRVAMFVLVCWAITANYHPGAYYKRTIMLLMSLSLIGSFLIFAEQIKWAIVLFLTVTALNLLLQIYALLITRGISKKIRILLGVSYAIYVVVFLSALVNLFPNLLPFHPLSSVNSFTDWRTSGGPAGLVVFLFVIIHNADRKLADSKALGILKVQAAQSTANAEKLSERQTLIDMLTHELKNPLGTIRFALAAFKRQSVKDDDTLHRIKRMDSSVARMNDLIEQVAGSNKIDRFELTDPLEIIDAAELIQEFTSDEQSNVQFQINTSPGVQFHSHRRMLSLIVENLIANAVKYADATEAIHIEVFEQNQMTIFRISNSVDPSQLPDPTQLFKRYYRHDSVQALPGMGIGLSLVKAACEKIGAHIDFSMEQNNITFLLKVPL